MNAKHALISIIISIALSSAFLANSAPYAAGEHDAKYLHFREITIDGNSDDWSGIDSVLFITNIREQGGVVVNITGSTFDPGNASLKQGDALIWDNNDLTTQGNPDLKHEISLGVEAPITWTSAKLGYGENDYLIVDDVDNYTYHTSRVQFTYPDGNVSVASRDWEEISYGVAFAVTKTHLYIAIHLLDISDEPDEGLYLKGVDVLFDDYADEAIEGENAFTIYRDGDDYESEDMYYEGGYLVDDEDDDETSDIEMDYSHETPDGGGDYGGDFFFEVEIPIDTHSFRDLGASTGMDIGVQFILRVSDQEQDARSSLPGVSDYYQGGGYPIILTHDIEEEGKIVVDPSEFVVIHLPGAELEEEVEAALEEAWLWILAVVSAVFGLLFGGTIFVWKRIKKKKADIKCKEEGICSTGDSQMKKMSRKQKKKCRLYGGDFCSI